MVLYNLFIVNKSGGLIYNKGLSPSSPIIQTNEWLRIGSTFHSLHAIAAQLDPTGSMSGIVSIEAGSFILRCLQTPTGIKFMITATANGFQHNSQAHLPTQDTSAAILAHALNATPTPNAQATNAASNAMGGILKEVYILYADYVLKNPFYELEMPIRCELFDQKVAKLNR
ncbi:hypothetical protein ScalyP_jg3637 [Parmales sp. scaly parma]|nr:hypothetical protein ScalyP_jg3637 [Parmales sp. scaly parma]